MMTNNDTNELPPSLLVSKGVNKFGRMLFHDLKKSTNLVFSPFSLSTALAMLTPGAKGNTLSQVKFPLKKCYFNIFPPTLLFPDKRITFSSLSSGNHGRVQVYSVNKKVEHLLTVHFNIVLVTDLFVSFSVALDIYKESYYNIYVDFHKLSKQSLPLQVVHKPLLF